MRKTILNLVLILTLSLLPISRAFAAPPVDVTNNKVAFSFPETATFSATITSKAEITSVVLEYGNEQLTCGEVVAEAFPEFTPSTTVNVSWTWDMRQFGAQFPGTIFWWQWRFIDQTGKETVTDKKTIMWLDNIHPWQTISSDKIRLHWYEGDDTYSQELLTAAVDGLKSLKNDAGLKTDQPIDIYIYANQKDMKDANPYAPSWFGGQADPESNLVYLDIADTGLTAEVHELTHVLVGHFTFSCIGFVPQWLNEGLAVYSEGPLDPQLQLLLNAAVQNNTLLSVRPLSGNFSGEGNQANLSYAESFSIVNFLIRNYGRDKMNSLLIAFRDGKTADEALTSVYGFNVDGLEDAWRQSLHAQPRTASAQPTALATPTFVPTIVPVSGAPLAVTPTPYAMPTSYAVPTPSLNSTPPASSGPPLGLTIALLGFCCLLLLIFGVTILGFVVRNQNMKRGKND